MLARYEEGLCESESRLETQSPRRSFLSQEAPGDLVQLLLKE